MSRWAIWGLTMWTSEGGWGAVYLITPLDWAFDKKQAKEKKEKISVLMVRYTILLLCVRNNSIIITYGMVSIT